MVNSNSSSSNPAIPLGVALFATASLFVLLQSFYQPRPLPGVPFDVSHVDQISYGIDTSWYIHRQVSTNYPWLPHNTDPTNNPTPKQYEGMPIQALGEERHRAYTNHVEGCRSFYGDRSDQCDIYEFDRILMNKRQPQSMQNYTELGFMKIQAPNEITKLIKDFWEKNKDKQKAEVWPTGNIYVNHWRAPTKMVSVDDMGLRGSGSALKKAVWQELHGTIEDWTGEDITPTSMYGIRVYTNNSVIAPHVDRLPLVASAMLNVAQDVVEDWPCEVYDHEGQAHNVTLHPGEMLLFESHSVLHGRPFPLNGKYYAMLFIHFEPTGHSLRHNVETPDDDVETQYKKHVEEGHGGQSSEGTNTLPPYIKRFSPEEIHWQQRHPEGWKHEIEIKKYFPDYSPHRTPKVARTNSQEAARSGDVAKLEEELANAKTHVVNERDELGWQLMHEATMSGRVEAVKLLLHNGADINARTNGGMGATPLWLAQREFGKAHKMVQYLKSLGALAVPPERFPGGSEL